MNRIEFINPDDYEPGQTIELPEDIERAILCLDRSKINVRNWRPLHQNELTDAEAAMYLLENVVNVPSGMLVGKPLRFMFFQEVLLYAIIDAKPSVFILSMARRNGKTFLLSCIALLNIISKLASLNSLITSAAMSRDQAALVYKEIEHIIAVSPGLKPFVRLQPSQKRVLGLVRNAEYRAIAAEAKTGFGQSFKIVVLDEAGQIIGPDNDYIAMLRSSQGSVEDPLFAIISTQAPSDADYLSIQIDIAIREQPKDTIVFVFETPKHYEIDDEEGWYYSNPGLGVFRSLKDMRRQVDHAKMLPETEARCRNLNLNQRIALENLWISPSVWRACSGPPSIEVLQAGKKVSVGIDLSMRVDLTAAVFSAEDDHGDHHLIPHIFAPSVGMEQRELRDKSPYMHWARTEQLIAVPGTIVEYEWVAHYLKNWCDKYGIEVTDVNFDRWRIDLFRKECDKIGLFAYAEWHPVGQGYKDMSPRVEYFESLLLGQRIRHGSHPLLNLSSHSAIAVRDPSGNRKLDKSRSTQRIDPIVAAVMATYSMAESEYVDVESWIA